MPVCVAFTDEMVDATGQVKHQDIFDRAETHVQVSADLLPAFLVGVCADKLVVFQKCFFHDHVRAVAIIEVSSSGKNSFFIFVVQIRVVVHVRSQIGISTSDLQGVYDLLDSAEFGQGRRGVSGTSSYTEEHSVRHVVLQRDFRME